jgi:hypothetical protein
MQNYALIDLIFIALFFDLSADIKLNTPSCPQLTILENTLKQDSLKFRDGLIGIAIQYCFKRMEQSLKHCSKEMSKSYNNLKTSIKKLLFFGEGSTLNKQVSAMFLLSLWGRQNMLSNDFYDNTLSIQEIKAEALKVLERHKQLTTVFNYAL